jgi:protein-S-isoprenylcysteine O-methyltransferase Ste14
LSLAGFSGFLVIDLPFVSRWLLLKGCVVAAAIGALVAAFTLATREGALLGFPSGCYWAGIAMMAVGGVLIIFSALVEIPLASASRHRADEWWCEVYHGGTYALCRHPAILWMVIYLAGLVMASNQAGAVFLAIWWFILEMVVITVQDLYVFPSLFRGYTEYRRTTPFVIPNLSSLRSLFQISTELNIDEQLPAENE